MDFQKNEKNGILLKYLKI